MKERNIPLKNYLILLLLMIVTIFIVFYLSSWYNTSKEYYQNNSILSEYLPELKTEEIDSFLIDNPEVVIYYASAKDENIKAFERDFKKLIEKINIWLKDTNQKISLSGRYKELYIFALAKINASVAAQEEAEFAKESPAIVITAKSEISEETSSSEKSTFELVID